MEHGGVCHPAHVAGTICCLLNPKHSAKWKPRVVGGGCSRPRFVHVLVGDEVKRNVDAKGMS